MESTANKVRQCNGKLFLSATPLTVHHCLLKWCQQFIMLRESNYKQSHWTPTVVSLKSLKLQKGWPNTFSSSSSVLNHISSGCTDRRFIVVRRVGRHWAPPNHHQNPHQIRAALSNPRQMLQSRSTVIDIRVDNTTSLLPPLAILLGTR
jgi:hypothetical protein